MSQKDAVGALAQHPRMIGVLFTLSVLLMQMGSVIANGSQPGP